MPIKPQTKLMKLVCKRAALMREPYRHPPWTTHQMSHVNKKESNVHKVKPTSKSIKKIKKITQQASLPIAKNKPLSKEVNHSKEIIDTPTDEETANNI